MMRAWRRGAWYGSVWPFRCYPAYPQATEATQPARSVPGATSPAPPGSGSPGLDGASGYCRTGSRRPVSRRASGHRQDRHVYAWWKTGKPAQRPPSNMSYNSVIGHVDLEQKWPCSTRPRRSLNHQPTASCPRWPGTTRSARVKCKKRETLKSPTQTKPKPRWELHWAAMFHFILTMN